MTKESSEDESAAESSSESKSGEKLQQPVKKVPQTRRNRNQATNNSRSVSKESVRSRGRGT